MIPKESHKVGARIDTLNGELSELRPISSNVRQKKNGEEELLSLKNSLKEIEDQIEKNQRQLDNGTNDMLDTINNHFGDLMHTLGYAGMVQKITDDNKNGLKILVKF